MLDEAEAPEAKNIDQAEGGGDDNAKPDDGEFVEQYCRCIYE